MEEGEEEEEEAPELYEGALYGTEKDSVELKSKRESRKVRSQKTRPAVRALHFLFQKSPRISFDIGDVSHNKVHCSSIALLILEVASHLF